MLNVLLVEDELIVRKGLIALINWDEYNMEVSFEATNGEQALEIIKNNNIDVVITDIRMPIMNGIDLTRNIKKLYPEIKVMLLTCYDDFEYVQEALELGASCYLLKTDLEEGSLEKQLLKVSSEIKTERDSQKTYKELEIKAKQTSFFLQESQIRALLKGNSSSLSLDVSLKWLNRPHMLIKLIVSENSLLENPFKEYFTEELNGAYVNFQLDSSSLLVIIEIPMDLNKEDFLTWQEKTIKQFTKEIAQRTNEFSLYYIKCHNVHELHERNNLLVRESNKHLFYHSYGYSICIEQRLTNEESTDYHPLNIQKLNELTILRKWSNVKELCEQAFQFYESYEVEEDFVKVNVVTMIETIMTGLQSNSHLFNSNWGSNSLDFKERVKGFSTFHELVDWFYQGLEYLEESRIVFIGGVNQVVQKAIAYIEMNYAEDITLDHLSKEVGLSKSYLSTVFKKETEKNIVEYINDLRIMKAKQLLLKSDLKVFEIAERIGFKDAKYFSKQFKRATGISPNDYKNNRHEFV